MFVRVFESTVMPGEYEGELEPANSREGMVVPYRAPLVRTSVETTKRLLRDPPAVSGLEKTTAPPPVTWKTASRKLVYDFCSPAARLICASFFTPVAS